MQRKQSTGELKLISNQASKLKDLITKESFEQLTADKDFRLSLRRESQNTLAIDLFVKLIY